MLPWSRDTVPLDPRAWYSVGSAKAPQARYLYSFLVTEQLEGAAVVLGEGGDLEVKGWRPPLSLLGKRFGLKTELDWIIYHFAIFPLSEKNKNQRTPVGKGLTITQHRLGSGVVSAMPKSSGRSRQMDPLRHVSFLPTQLGRSS